MGLKGCLWLYRTGGGALSWGPHKAAGPAGGLWAFGEGESERKVVKEAAGMFCLGDAVHLTFCL